MSMSAYVVRIVCYYEIQHVIYLRTCKKKSTTRKNNSKLITIHCNAGTNHAPSATSLLFLKRILHCLFDASSNYQERREEFSTKNSSGQALHCNLNTSQNSSHK